MGSRAARNSFIFVKRDINEPGRCRLRIQILDNEVELTAPQRWKDLVCIRNNHFHCYTGFRSEQFSQCDRRKLMINYDRTDTNSNMPRMSSAHVRDFAR